MPQALQHNHVSREVLISYDSLARYLPDFEISPERITLMPSDSLYLELRISIFQVGTPSPRKRFVLVFLFDKARKNRLLKISPADIDIVSEFLAAQNWIQQNDVAVLVGKSGSRLSSQLSLIFQVSCVCRIVVVDFDGKLPLVDFLREFANDIDRVESRMQSLLDPARMDLTSLPLCDRRIREGGPGKKELVIFANQLLQLNGVAEPLAVSLAEAFKNPLSLMNQLAVTDVLQGFSYTTRNQDVKPNSRVKSSIKKLFDLHSHPDDKMK
jgi:hypothetical protein